jgi:ribonuclease HII
MSESFPVRGGIDEAGLGSLLGPLAIGWSAVETELPSQNAWDAWAPLVRRELPKKQKSAHLVVADSKKVFSRNERGRARLERTALAFLAQLLPKTTPPTRFVELFAPPIAPLGPAPEHLAAPWLTSAAATDLALAQHCDAGGLELLAERLRRVICDSPVRLVGAGLRLVPALQLNRSYDETNNKGTTVVGYTLDALAELWHHFAARGLEVVVDRQGGRAHYGSALAKRFPHASVRMIEERPGTSAYRLDGRRGTAEEGWRLLVSFTERGEDHCFATALGSCLAKFGRETAMAAFNAHFGAQQDGLKPTAGYTQDGRRWLIDAAPLLEAVDRRVLVRDR